MVTFFLLDWRFVPVAVVAVLLVERLYRSQQPAAAVEPRKKPQGEQRIAKLLEPLEYADHRVFHDCYLTSGKILEHLVIGRGGVFVVDSDALGLRVQRDQRETRGTPLRGDGTRAPTRLVTMVRAEAREVAAQLRAELDERPRVIPLIAVHDARMPSTIQNVDGVAIMSFSRVNGFINRKRDVYTPEQVAALADAAKRAFSPKYD